jgi:hypothetical protein
VINYPRANGILVDQMGSLNFNSAIATAFLLGYISQNIGASTAEQSYGPCVQGNFVRQI